MKSAFRAGILGSADGCTSIAGVIAAGAATGSTAHAIGITAIGGALAATVSMGGAEMLSEDKTDWVAIGAMALGTIIGGGIPALPLLWASGSHGYVLVAVLAILIAIGVGEIRYRVSNRSRKTAISGTLAVLSAGAVVGLIVGLAG